MLWLAATISIILLTMILVWHRCRRLDWRIKLLTARLNKITRCRRQENRITQRLLKDIYAILNRSMAEKNELAAYQCADMLKLAFGCGVIRQDESVKLMRASVAVLNSDKPDAAGFILDVFRPLIRQLPLEDILGAVEQLTLLGVVALRRKQNFLAAKVVEFIFLIMERTDVAGDKKILMAALNALKVIGVIGLRRRDFALFREISTCLSAWSVNSPGTNELAESIISVLTAWLHRIVGLNDVLLFDIIATFTFSLVEAETLPDNAIVLLIDEWGNIAAAACLNPNSPMAGIIVEFIFKVANRQNDMRHWINAISSAGRVAKLAVSQHGLSVAFMVVHPMLEIGRKLLWTELKIVQHNNEFRQQLLFRLTRECLIIVEFAARQDMMGSSGDFIVEIFRCWEKQYDITSHSKSVKKFCQLLLLLWIKNKRKAKKYMPQNTVLTDPILFSEIERQRLGI